jgi:hypothetical protein
MEIFETGLDTSVRGPLQVQKRGVAGSLGMHSQSGAHISKPTRMATLNGADSNSIKRARGANQTGSFPFELYVSATSEITNWKFHAKSGAISVYVLTGKG